MVEADIVEYLTGKCSPQDLIVSVDTLNYFGDLDEVLAAIHGALNPQGVLCFTLEKTVASTEHGYLLTQSGRYAHQKSYAEAALARASLTIIECDEVVLRLESGQPVTGYLFLAGVTSEP